jgi:SAM-dependent methyltransferase
MTGAQPYDFQFYDRQRQGSFSSARVIVPLVIDLFQPRSVIDVGCGVGTWLSVFNQHGVADIVGVDGEWARAANLQIPDEKFVAADLTRPISMTRHFDLAMSLEVAEHLTPDSAEQFVDSLTALAPLVLFSAAIPHQGGTGHVNERWLSYWVELFARRAFSPIDCVRPRVWHDATIQWWYAQNTIVFVKNDSMSRWPRVTAAAPGGSLPLDVVHPRSYVAMSARAEAAERAGTHLSLSMLVRSLPRAGWRALHRLLP